MISTCICESSTLKKNVFDGLRTVFQKGICIAFFGTTEFDDRLFGTEVHYHVFVNTKNDAFFTKRPYCHFVRVFVFADEILATFFRKKRDIMNQGL